MRSAIATKIQAMVDLETEMLEPRSIDTLLIAGAVTNICCESSARDAVELCYKVIMVSSQAMHTACTKRPSRRSIESSVTFVQATRSRSFSRNPRVAMADASDLQWSAIHSVC